MARTSGDGALADAEALLRLLATPRLRHGGQPPSQPSRSIMATPPIIGAARVPTPATLADAKGRLNVAECQRSRRGGQGNRMSNGITLHGT